ncbi:MAG TPA: ABC transporter permease/substrate-binding protein [Kofleriaceae bacterium]|jgi:osmoprotectant transport system permease protein
MTELMRGAAPLLASHLWLVIVALFVACAISVPLAIVVADRPRLAFPVVTVAGLIQTIPGLALLALMVAVIAGTHGFGLGISAFGFPPAVIALTLYAILPILRNAVTGLRGVDPAVVEAARGMGMTRGQLMRWVQLPLAAPVIAAGIRTATVWTVGAATLATPVGQSCLGNYIFAGLQTRNWNMLIAGVIAAAGLAIVLDLILGAIEHALAKRKSPWPAIGALTGVIVLGLAILPRLGGANETTTVAARREVASSITKVRIGAKTYTEQYILVEVLKQRLQAAGIAVEVVESLGSTVVFDSLVGGQIDAYVDYSGTLWTTQLKRESGTPRWRVLVELEAWLADRGVRSLGPLGFENAYAIVVSRATANRLHATKINDLAGPSTSLAMGGDYEWFSRGEWTSVRDTYGLHFARTATFDPSLLYDAVAKGEIDAIAGFSSDGRIAANDLVTLDDPRSALPPYDAMILLSPRVANDPNVACALAPLRGAINVDLMRRANLMVDRATDKQSPAAAATWLLTEAHVQPGCH